MAGPQDRQTEYTKWAASRPGVPGTQSARRYFRDPLQRPVLTFLGILAFAIVLGGGAYAMFGAGGPALSADHEAVVDTLDLDGGICCIEYAEIDGSEYLFVTVLDSAGFWRDSRPPDVSLRVIAIRGGEMDEIASIDAPIDSMLPRSTAMIDSTLFIPLGVSQLDERGIWAVDVGDPWRPEEIGLERTEGFVTSAATDGVETLITHAAGEFAFYETSDPRALELLAEFKQPVSSVDRMTFDPEAGRLYEYAVRSNRVNIADVSDLESIEPLGRHQNEYRRTSSQHRVAEEIEDSGDRLDQTAPTEQFLDFAVSGDVMYVAASDLGIEVVDASDPAEPKLIGRIAPGDRTVRTIIAGNVLHALTVDEHSRERLEYEVHTFDVIDPGELEYVKTVDGIRAAPGRQAIETGGGYVFLGLNDTIAMIAPDS